MDTLTEIKKVVDIHTVKEQQNVASHALIIMQRGIALLKSNPTLKQPHTMETIIRWMEDDMSGFKSRYFEK